MRQQFRVFSGLARRRGQRLQDVTLFDENGEPLILVGTPSPVILSPSILPDGITDLDGLPFGYMESGGVLRFFGSLVADGVSQASIGNEPFLPLNITTLSPNTFYFPTNIDGSNDAPSQLIFPDTDGFWCRVKLESTVSLDNISFIGSIN